MPVPADPASPAPAPHVMDERGAALGLLPVAATLDYYALPDWLQVQPLVQLGPQIIGYLAFALWMSRNETIGARLGVQISNIRAGAKLGLLTGIVLGCLNTLVILLLTPWLGFDISFLKE